MPRLNDRIGQAAVVLAAGNSMRCQVGEVKRVATS